MIDEGENRHRAARVLLFFARVVQIALSMLGFIQCIGPTTMLLLSVFVFKESVFPVLLIPTFERLVFVPNHFVDGTRTTFIRLSGYPHTFA
ncbi:hypothetical protein CHH59_06940 [Shouchella clausii]|nr:hypothetical protein CHH59_06940 [Shouchella clausii]